MFLESYQSKFLLTTVVVENPFQGLIALHRFLLKKLHVEELVCLDHSLNFHRIYKCGTPGSMPLCEIPIFVARLFDQVKQIGNPIIIGAFSIRQSREKIINISINKVIGSFAK